MEKIAKNAKVRKRDSAKSTRNALLMVIGGLMFSMMFCLIMLINLKSESRIVVLDNAGEVLAGKVTPVKNAKEYHNHLKNMAIAGIYAIDERGRMNNNLEVMAENKVIRKVEENFAPEKKLFREKRIVQYPRVGSYVVDVISRDQIQIKVVLQVIRDAFALDGRNFEGLEEKNVILYFERNQALESSYYRPWSLVDYREMDVN